MRSRSGKFIFIVYLLNLVLRIGLLHAQEDFVYLTDSQEMGSDFASSLDQNELSVSDSSGVYDFSKAPHFFSFVDFEYAVGKTVGIDRNYGTLGFFAGASLSSGWTTFIDFKERSIDNGKWGTNIGFGARYLSPCTCRYTGANLFYDYRESCYKGFNQVGVGFESLGYFWDFRINGYFPLGNKDHKGPITIFDGYVGDYIVTCQPRIFALTGFDAEIGLTLWECDCFNVYLAAGPYYYSKNKFESSWGGRCRLQCQCNDYFSCEIKVTHDCIYDTRVQAILRIEIPFDLFFCKFRKSCSNNVCWSNRCLRPVQRNDLIILDNTSCWTTNY